VKHNEGAVNEGVMKWDSLGEARNLYRTGFVSGSSGSHSYVLGESESDGSETDEIETDVAETEEVENNDSETDGLENNGPESDEPDSDPDSTSFFRGIYEEEFSHGLMVDGEPDQSFLSHESRVVIRDLESTNGAPLAGTETDTYTVRDLTGVVSSDPQTTNYTAVEEQQESRTQEDIVADYVESQTQLDRLNQLLADSADDPAFVAYLTDVIDARQNHIDGLEIEAAAAGITSEQLAAALADAPAADPIEIENAGSDNLLVFVAGAVDSAWAWGGAFIDGYDVHGYWSDWMSDPTTALGQMVTGDILGNQIWGDFGIYASYESSPFTISTPWGWQKRFEGGIGFELIYDWGNDGNPGTGWNLFWYPQAGVSTSSSTSVGFGAVSAYNFRPDNYLDTFINVNGTVPIPTTGAGPSLGFSATPNGIGQFLAGQPVTEPHSFYGGVSIGEGWSLDLEWQEYDLVGDNQWNFMPGGGW